MYVSLQKRCLSNLTAPPSNLRNTAADMNSVSSILLAIVVRVLQLSVKKKKTKLRRRQQAPTTRMRIFGWKKG